MKGFVMNKELIFKNEELIKETINSVKDLIVILNQNIDFINNENITIDTIKEIVINKKAYKNIIYQKTLKNVCEEFGVNYDKARFVTFKWLHEDLLVYNIANIRNKQWYQFINDIPNNIKYFMVDYIRISDKEVSLKDNAINVITERFSYYTENEKQNKIVRKLKQI